MLRTLMAGVVAGLVATLGADLSTATGSQALDSPILVGPEHEPAAAVGRGIDDQQQFAALAWNGSTFLAVWVHLPGTPSASIRAARITPSGSILDLGAIVISSAPGFKGEPDVAWDGSNFLVVWQDHRGTTADVYGARVSPAGALLDPAGIPISTTRPGDQLAPSVAWGGGTYLVVWEDQPDAPGGYRHVYGTRVTAAGVVSNPEGRLVAHDANEQFDPAVAWNGVSFQVAWTDTRSLSTADIYGTRIDPSTGTALDLPGVPIAASAADESAPSLAWNGTNLLVAWEQAVPGTIDIHGGRLGADGKPLDGDGFAISTAAGAQRRPVVAWGGSTYFVAWNDFRSDPNYNDLYGARVTSAGAVSDPAGKAVSSAANHQSNAAVAFDGTHFVVVWDDSRGPSADIYGARVTPASGEPIDPTGFLVSLVPNSQDRPAVACDGTNYLVVWSDDRAGPRRDIYGARITPDGVSLDGAGFAITTADHDQSDPDVAWNGFTYLVTWTDRRSDFSNWEDIYAARVTPGAVVLDPNGIAVSSRPRVQGDPTVAWDGLNFMIAWTDGRSMVDQDVYGARVNPAGAVLDPDGISISSAQGSQLEPDVAWDGSNSLVVWRDGRLDPSSDVYGGRVNTHGVAIDGSGFPIASGAGSQWQPSVASNGSLSVVVWTGTYDVFATRIAPAGAVLDPFGIPVAIAPAEQSFPQIVWDGLYFLAAWDDSRSGGVDLFGGRITGTGAALDGSGFPIAASSDAEVFPALERGTGADAAIVYNRRTQGANRARLRLVTDQPAPPAPPAPPPPPPPPPAPPPPPPPPAGPPPPRPVVVRRCVVPRVIRLKLVTAKSRIRRANCSVGRIRRVRSKRIGRVLSQSPRAGARRARGARVSLVVGRR